MSTATSSGSSGCISDSTSSNRSPKSSSSSSSSSSPSPSGPSSCGGGSTGSGSPSSRSATMGANSGGHALNSSAAALNRKHQSRAYCAPKSNPPGGLTCALQLQQQQPPSQLQQSDATPAGYSKATALGDQPQAQQLSHSSSSSGASIASSSSSGSSSSVTAFLSKLWRMVNDQNNSELIRWSQSGCSFVIINQIQFAKDLLPLYFKHSNMASFIRQLNMYGFRKIPLVGATSTPPLLADDYQLQQQAQGQASRLDVAQFYHVNFLRGQKQRLSSIRRKNNSSKTHNLIVNGSFCDEVRSMLLDVKSIRDSQNSSESILGAIQLDNKSLWRDVAVLRNQHYKQRRVIEKLIQFLLSLIQNRTNVVKKRKMKFVSSQSDLAYDCQAMSERDGCIGFATSHASGGHDFGMTNSSSNADDQLGADIQDDDDQQEDDKRADEQEDERDDDGDQKMRDLSQAAIGPLALNRIAQIGLVDSYANFAANGAPLSSSGYCEQPQPSSSQFELAPLSASSSVAGGGASPGSLNPLVASRPQTTGDELVPSGDSAAASAAPTGSSSRTPETMRPNNGPSRPVESPHFVSAYSNRATPTIQSPLNDIQLQQQSRKIAANQRTILMGQENAIMMSDQLAGYQTISLQFANVSQQLSQHQAQHSDGHNHQHHGQQQHQNQQQQQFHQGQQQQQQLDLQQCGAAVQMMPATGGGIGVAHLSDLLGGGDHSNSPGAISSASRLNCNYGQWTANSIYNTMSQQQDLGGSQADGPVFSGDFRVAPFLSALDTIQSSGQHGNSTSVSHSNILGTSSLGNTSSATNVSNNTQNGGGELNNICGVGGRSSAYY